MAYTERNFRKRKELTDYFLTGRPVYVYQPGPFGPGVRDGQVALEGPHYPAPHSWYATGTVSNGELVDLKHLTKAQRAEREAAVAARQQDAPAS